MLAKIWADLLGLDRVGVQDNFLDMGGHSLLAMQVVSRVIDQFRVELPLQSLLESPTVADMAAAISEARMKRVTAQEIRQMLDELEDHLDE